MNPGRVASHIIQRNLSGVGSGTMGHDAGPGLLVSKAGKGATLEAMRRMNNESCQVRQSFPGVFKRNCRIIPNINAGGIYRVQ